MRFGSVIVGRKAPLWSLTQTIRRRDKSQFWCILFPSWQKKGKKEAVNGWEERKKEYYHIQSVPSYSVKCKKATTTQYALHQLLLQVDLIPNF